MNSRLTKRNLSFISGLLLLLFTIITFFPNQILCFESDGTTSIEIAPLGNCTTVEENSISSAITQISQNCNQSHQDSVTCKNCTDIPLKQETSLSRSDSEQATLKVLSPSYFNLYAGEYKPYIPYPTQSLQPFPLQTPTFVYHPHQTLESIILLI